RSGGRRGDRRRATHPAAHEMALRLDFARGPGVARLLCGRRPGARLPAHVTHGHRAVLRLGARADVPRSVHGAPRQPRVLDVLSLYRGAQPDRPRGRGGGKAYRYGGEEFAVIFPGRGAEACVPDLEAVRQLVEDTRFILRSRFRSKKKKEKVLTDRGPGERVPVTISIGVAEKTDRHAK